MRTATWGAALAVAGTVALAIAPVAAGAQADLGIGIELTTMSPRLVTADGPGVLSVIGRVSNRGDRTIQQLDVRVQRGEPVGSEADLRTALAGDAVTDSTRPRFVNLPGTLEPGASAPFRVDVPLRGGGPLDSLQITQPGVYPLLINLNGRPDFGGRARLAAVRMLLPVLGLPAQDMLPGAPQGTTRARLPAVAPAPPAAPASTPLTIIWPIVDVPHRLPTVDDAPVVLRNDSLAGSLAEGGRLYGLVHAALDAASTGSPLAGAMCVAVDPDLVDTVRLMANPGYQLADGSPGAGGQAAAGWLRSLRELAGGRCVLALPMADADLVALSRAGLTDLQGRARADGAQILREALGVEPLTDLVWPADEVLDERTLTDLANPGAGAVLLRPDGLTDPAGYAGQSVVGLATGAPATASERGVLVDTVVGQALAGSSPSSQPSESGEPGGSGGPAPQVPQVPVTTSGRSREAGRSPEPAQPGAVRSTSPAGTAAPLSGQDGLAALAYRATTGDQTGVLLAPPRRWSADTVEAGELLRTAGRLITDGWARPRGIGELVSGGAPRLTATLDYPAQAGTAEVARSIIASVGATRDELRDLDKATRRDPRVGYDPARLLDPVRFNLLRAASTAWRSNEDTAREFAQQSDDRLRELREKVEIVPPGGPYLLAASNSPLLLNLNNPLPVQVDVQITLSRVAGLRTAPVDVISLPAGSRRQVRVAAEVLRAGQFSVEAHLATPGGTSLGPRGGAASRIQLRSTAYGTVTLAITGGAAVALVLLTGLRITRRVRAARTADTQAAPAGPRPTPRQT
jgi:hypothetical protein